MKLSPETKAQLRALDFEYGGGITTLGAKIDMIDKPVLIVGLGGTGVESLIRAKKAINRHFKSHTMPDGRKMDKPLQVEYLAIDSDDNLENLRYAGMSFNRENNEFVLLESANLTSIYKNRDAVFKNFTQDWIADNLRLQQVKHGAGGIRQAGRFLLFININNVISALTEKINRLTTNRKANDLLFVFILAGSAGGTGSGIYIDIPYIVRKIAEQKGFETENIGMIFLPDVTLSDNTIDGSAALNIKANGFASLKELDYLMNIERSGEYFEQTYADLDVNTNLPPYDLCHLISAKDESGKMIPAAKNYCMNVAAETIINFIASEEVTDGQSYTINSYLSNIENNKAAFLMTHQQKQPTNYIYNIVGASSAVLPVEYLTNHLTYKIFRELEPLFDRNPTMEATQQTLEAFKLDLPSMERALGENKPKVRSFKQYDYTVLEKHPDIIEDAIRNELHRLTEHYEIRAAQIIEGIRQTLADKNNILAQHFVDLELGPFYTLKELSDLNEQSLLKGIETIRKRDIQQKREHRDSIAAMEVKKQLALEKLKHKPVLPFLALGKKTQTEQVIKISEVYFKAVVKNAAYDAIDRIYEATAAMLTEYHDEIIETYCELLIALKDLFDKFKNPEQKAQTEYLGETFTWDIADAKDFCDSFEANKDQSLVIDNKAVLKQLLKDIISNPTWLPSPRNHIVDNLNAFITRQLQNVLHKSLDYYCSLLAKGANIAPDQYIGEKIEALRETAKVMFPMNHIPTGLHIEFPPYAYVSVPANAPTIRSKVRQMSSTGRISNIKYSKMVNRLYMLNLKIAVALYCYKELNDYESVYEASLSKIAGLHLYENKVKNWKNLPSPNYDRLWTAGYENPRERNKNNRTRAIFDQAMAYGLIKMDEKSRRYVCFYGDPVDPEQRFSHIEKGIAGKTLSATNARTMMAEINDFMSAPERRKYQTPLFDTEFIPETNTPDKEYAKGVFIYMPELNERMEGEVAIRKFTERLQTALEKIDQSEIIYSHFAQVLYMGVIYKNRKNYKYNLDSEEKILFTMQNLSDRFVEYDVFQAYLNLSEKESTFLQKRAQDEENDCTDEQYNQLIKVIDVFIKTFTEKLELLNKTFSAERDGALKKIFYREMLDVFIKEKTVLS